MTFQEKLVFLMDITNTSNKVLADYIHVDPSLISLLKRGKRKKPSNRIHLQNMAGFFQMHIFTDYQINALSEKMNMPNLSVVIQEGSLESVIYEWLDNNNTSKLDFSSYFSQEDNLKDYYKDLMHNSVSSLKSNDFNLFYGNSGKAEALQRFSKFAQSLNTPMVIYFMNDEDTDWAGSPNTQLGDVIPITPEELVKNIQIIQITPPSQSEQFIRSVLWWMPYYMTLKVRPYYYPRHRDNTFRMTLAIIPGKMGLISQSFQGFGETLMTCLSTDIKFIDSLERMFLQYLEKCKPCGTIISEQDQLIDITRTSLGPNNFSNIIRSATLSSITAPDSLIYNALKAENDPKMVKLEEEITQLVPNFISEKDYYDFCSLAPANYVTKGIVYKPRELSQNSIFYTPDEYVLHLENILYLLETNKNYHFIPCEFTQNRKYTVWIKDEKECLIYSNTEKPFVFKINYPEMINQFIEHYHVQSESILANPNGRELVISKIKRLIREIKADSNYKESQTSI